MRPALAAGLNAAAELVKLDPIDELGRDLDSPNPFTLNAFGILPATPVPGRDPDIVINIQPLQAAYLGYQIDGNVRRAGDHATTKQGLLVPGPHAKLDRYGNLPRGYVARMQQRDDDFWTTFGFSDKPALVPRGAGNELKILALIVDEIAYERTFDLFDVVGVSAHKHVPVQVSKKLDATKRADS
ncbi:hypothetical protein [Devosia pacifica]|uniref:hypothetical protein n=1 Tax=Devosia pacifica TaxID=1335967 RepID=UPI00167709ED|nr:hypothetical protein [Devosia pacifica]